MTGGRVMHRTFLGLPAVEFSCGGYEGIWTADGADLVRLRHVPTGTALLRTPADLEQFRTRRAFGMPVLLFPNRIAGGCFSFQGRTFQFPVNYKGTMHIHGLLDNSTTWNIAKAEAAGEAVCVVFQYLFDENNPAYAYFDYKISITYENTVTQAGLRQSISFTNYSNRAMPFAFAYHTAFNLPFNASPKEAFVVQANLKGMYELHNELPTGRVTALDEAGTQAAAAGYCIRGAALDHLYLADSSRQNRAVLTDTASGTSIVYEAGPQFKHWILCSGGGQSGFLAIEPQTCCTNAVNMDIPSANLLALQPQETICLKTRLYVQAGK